MLHILRSPLLRWSIPSQWQLVVARPASNLKKRMDVEEARERNVIDFKSSKSKRRTKRVYVWGHAVTGALGVKGFLEAGKTGRRVLVRNRPYKLEFFDDLRLEVTDVACGYGFSLCTVRAPTGEKLFGSGINTDSQLGYAELGGKTGRFLDYITEPGCIQLPLKSPESTRLRHIACGRAHSVILTDEGMFSLGNNSYGQCGRAVVEGEVYRGSQIINKVPVPENITQVVCGQDHTILLTGDGELYACGLGADGQTGQGHFDLISCPSRMRGEIDGKRVVHVSCMADTVLAVTDEGVVYGCGNSEYNQLGSATNEMQTNRFLALPLDDVGHVIKVAAGGTACAVLNDKGDVYVWGFGILGKGPDLDQTVKPQKLPPTLFGKNEFNKDVRVVDVKAGIGQFAAITDKGDLFMWGRNNHGILGLGLKAQQNQFFPLKCAVPASVTDVAIGVDHVIVQCKAFV